MAQFLLSGTHGPDDPTRATLPFHFAKSAIETGHQVSIALIADATFLLNDHVRDSISGVGMPALKDLFQFAIEHGVRVYV